MYAVVIPIVVIIIFLNFIVRRLTFWKRNGVPQYSVVKILQNNFNILVKKQSAAEMLENYCKEFRNHRYFGMTLLFQNYLVVHDLELIKQIAIKDFSYFQSHAIGARGIDPLWDKNLFALHGSDWKKMRQILNPVFKSSNVDNMMQEHLICVNTFMEHFEKQLSDNYSVTFDAEDVFTRFLTDVIARVAFGYECNSFKNRTHEFFLHSKRIIPEDSLLESLKMLLIFHVPELAKLFRVKLYPKSSSNFFSNIVSNNIKDRKANGIVRTDMIQKLLESVEYNNKLTEIDITAHTLTYFTAGFETTSILACFTSYELAINNDIQKRLQNEIDKSLEKYGNAITNEALREMTYMDMVILESLRKWPTAVASDRECSKPYVIQPKSIGEKAVYLKKGDGICLPLFGIHRNPDIFNDPEKFDPERFDKNKVTNVSDAFMGFGVGPRTCIANNWSHKLIKLLFVVILSKFDIITVDKTRIPLRLAKVIKPLRAEGGIWLGFRKRVCL